jgi:DNA-binding response OmpR family regulator
VATNEYQMIIINSDKNDFLSNIKLVREISLIPILVTSSRYDLKKKFIAIESGADGYTQIINSAENIHVSVKSLLRRSVEYDVGAKENMPYITNGEITLDLTNRKTTVNGNAVTLTGKEFDIL